MWIQPSAPLLSRLSGWRVRSKPSRVSAWVRPEATYSGPAAAAHASNARRGRAAGRACPLWTREAVTVVIGLSLLE
jgi:hypothetical protein